MNDGKNTKIMMDNEMMKKQTLKWCDGIPRNKLNLEKMVVMFDENGKIKFVPKHLV